MALSTYAELKAAIRTESGAGTGLLSDDAITDAVKRAEAKINRRTRLRNVEDQVSASLTTASRFVAVPSGTVEVISVSAKASSDTTYTRLTRVPPDDIDRYYGAERLRYCLRDQFEFSDAVDRDLLIHRIRDWDIATDSSNWLLTNYPDLYLNGAMVEVSLHIRNMEEMAIWRTLFDDAMAELDEVDARSRDDVELYTETGRFTRSRYSVLTD
jgi:hypothetical protein